MRKILMLVCLPLLTLSPSAQAETALPPHHSVVKLVFVVPTDSNRPMLGGSVNQAIAQVGETIVPADQVAPISITIDEKFVGHAMAGIVNVTPNFVLAAGSYEFAFTCDGYQPIKQKLNVIGSGSEQYLLVEMRKKPSSQKDDAPKASSDTP